MPFFHQQVMQRRGANIMVETGSTLATATSVDVSNDVLVALNAAMPTIQRRVEAYLLNPGMRAMIRAGSSPAVNSW